MIPKNKDLQIIELLSLLLKALKRLPEKHAQTREKNDLLKIEDSFCDTHTTDVTKS